MGVKKKANDLMRREEGILPPTSLLPFIGFNEVIPLHIWRYNRNINLLIAAEEIDEEKVDGKKITWDMFFDARQKKIKNYWDCIDCLTQKEELLQFHNRDFKVEWNVEEKVIIKEEKPKYDIHLLSEDEKEEWIFYSQKSDTRFTLSHFDSFIPSSVKFADRDSVFAYPQKTVSSSIQTNTATITEVNQTPLVQQEGVLNIEEIKHEIIEAPVEQPSVDPTKKLREALLKLAAKKLLDAGANLDEDEKSMIEKED